MRHLLDTLSCAWLALICFAVCGLLSWGLATALAIPEGGSVIGVLCGLALVSLITILALWRVANCDL